VETTSPVSGSRKTFGARPFLEEKSNIEFSVPASASIDWSPMRPSFQLSSTKRRIEDWSVRLWST
jgi:hypothetical protein